MATYRSGSVRRATNNSVTAAQRSATNRRCSQCGRKSALKFHSDEFSYGHYCRWADCGWTGIKQRSQPSEQSKSGDDGVSWCR